MDSYRVDVKKDWVKTVSFIGIVIFLEFLGAIALTVGKGFEDASFTNRFLVYLAFIIIGVGGILFSQYKNKISRKRIFLIPLHEPEESLFLGQFKVFKNPVLLLFVGLIVFIPIFFVSAKYANAFFSGIPFKPQQISLFSNLFGDSIFPAISENNLMYVPIILLLSLNYFLFYRLKIVYWFNNIFSIPLIMAFLWKAFHNVVYGSSDPASTYTFVFGYIGILLTLVTMSAILWFVMHLLADFFLSAKVAGILSTDVFIVEILFIELALIILFAIILYVGSHSHKRGSKFYG